MRSNRRKMGQTWSHYGTDAFEGSVVVVVERDDTVCFNDQTTCKGRNWQEVSELQKPPFVSMRDSDWNTFKQSSVMLIRSYKPDGFFVVLLPLAVILIGASWILLAVNRDSSFSLLRFSPLLVFAGLFGMTYIVKRMNVAVDEKMRELCSRQRELITGATIAYQTRWAEICKPRVRCHTRQRQCPFHSRAHPAPAIASVKGARTFRALVISPSATLPAGAQPSMVVQSGQCISTPAGFQPTAGYPVAGPVAPVRRSEDAT